MNLIKFKLFKRIIINKHGRLIIGPNAYLVSGALINQRKIIKIKQKNNHKSSILKKLECEFFFLKIINKNNTDDKIINIEPICNNAALK